MRLDAQLGKRMVEREAPGMEELALQAEVAGGAVHGIPGDRKVDRSQMDADLVRPAGLELDAEERMAVEELGDLEVRNRLPRCRAVE